MKRILCLAVALLLMLSACAEIVKPSQEFWYLDDANVLSDLTEGIIFFANERLEEACGAEMVVVTVKSTGRMSIDDYTYTLFNEWNIGGNSYRGFLLLLAIDDENYYAMVGPNLEHIFTSATLSELQMDYLEKDFAAGNYDAGVRKFFEASYNKLADALNLDLSVDDAVSDYEKYIMDMVGVAGQPSRSDRNGNGVNFGSILLIVVLLIALVWVTKRFSGKRQSTASFSRMPHQPSRPVNPRSRGSSGFATGFMLGSMMRSRQPRPRVDHRPSGFGGATRSSSGSSNRSFGSNRIMGSARSASSTVRRSSGFGGATRRGGGGMRGPSTRGGGAGRFSRK